MKIQLMMLGLFLTLGMVVLVANGTFNTCERENDPCMTVEKDEKGVVIPGSEKTIEGKVCRKTNQGGQKFFVCEEKKEPQANN